MTNQGPNSNDPSDEGHKRFDLEERTAVFGEQAIDFAKSIPVNDVTQPLIRQIVRSATSIGANYCEANDAESKKDFRHKIGLCRKESRETKHWIRMIVKAHDNSKTAGRVLWQEAKELNLIFSSILRSNGG